MSLKGMREQNDISIIIGNLPKRLQQKIAENCYGSTITDLQLLATTAATGSTCNGSNALKLSTNNKNINVDIVAPEHVPSPNCKLHEEVNAADEDTDAAVIPGILRLQLAEKAQSHATRTSNKLLDVAALSPARQLSKSAIALPNWCELPTAPPIVKELRVLHATFMEYIKRDTVLQYWQKFNEVRNELQQIFSKLLLQHLKFCCEQKVDTFFWKLLFYNVREQLKQQTAMELVQKYILEMCEDGLQFYLKLHEQIVAKYLAIDATIVRKRNSCEKYEFIAKVMAQKLLISLGDLSRYRTKQLQSNDFNEAAGYYLRAQQLIPSNGIPYNQLAIVAIQSRKKFDAVYFHMRSLMSSNAIYSARESLLVLFDDIRKKYEETESKRSPIQRNQQRLNYQKSNRLRLNDKNVNNQQQECAKSSLRKEIWLHPQEGVKGRLHCNDFRNDGNTDGFKLLKEQQIKYDHINDEELLREFINLYLYVIGKLYTAIGMENLVEHQNKLCAQLNSLLHRDSFAESCGRKRLLKIVTLNIFILDHNKNQDTRREMRYHAFLFGNQMFGLVLQQCNKLLKQKSCVKENQNVKESFFYLDLLLQYVHLYCKWLFKNADIWEQLRKSDYDYNCWQELEHLFEYTQRLVLLENGKIDMYTRAAVMLDEESFAAGFLPLCEQKERSSIYTDQQLETKYSQFYTRLVRILNMRKCYEGYRELLKLEKLPQEYEIEEFKYILNTMNKSDNHNCFKKSKSATELLRETVGTTSILNNGKNAAKDDLVNSKLHKPENDDELLQLSKLKRELEAKTNCKRLYTAKLEEILNHVDTKLYIQVRPKFLLPDTNCFIDSIDDFEKLVQEFKCYTLIIPLTVVKELDGLSKGIKIESYQTALPKDRIHHYDDVSTRAKRSLEFIRNTKNQIKCATTKGSIINASLFGLVEEEYVSNDDKILATAIALSKNFSSETNAGGRCFIQTELVLITTDRNLRVKALTRKLAVSDLGDFLDWTSDKKSDCDGSKK